MTFSIIDILSSVLAGMLSVFSPCILPILPIILTGSEKDSKLRPIFIILGLGLVFIMLGVASSLFGGFLNGRIDYLEKIGAVIIFIFGMLLIANVNIFKKITIFNKLLSDKMSSFPDFFLGMAFGLLWVPCTGPILSSILTLVAGKGSVVTGIILLSFYSLGFAIPMLIVAYFSQFFRTQVSSRLPDPKYISMASGILLVLFSIYSLLTS
jgi:cytochrome c-type biogenesis protein